MNGFRSVAFSFPDIKDDKRIYQLYDIHSKSLVGELFYSSQQSGFKIIGSCKSYEININYCGNEGIVNLHDEDFFFNISYFKEEMILSSKDSNFVFKWNKSCGIFVYTDMDSNEYSIETGLDLGFNSFISSLLSLLSLGCFRKPPYKNLVIPREVPENHDCKPLFLAVIIVRMHVFDGDFSYFN